LITHAFIFNKIDFALLPSTQLFYKTFRFNSVSKILVLDEFYCRISNTFVHLQIEQLSAKMSLCNQERIFKITFFQQHTLSTASMSQGKVSTLSFVIRSLQFSQISAYLISFEYRCTNISCIAKLFAISKSFAMQESSSEKRFLSGLQSIITYGSHTALRTRNINFFITNPQNPTFTVIAIFLDRQIPY